MDKNHTEFQDNLAAYALGALDAEEAAALEAHLRTCDTCTAELAEYGRVSAGLLTALPARVPRSVVRRNLQKRLAGERSQARPQFNWSFGRLAFAAVLAVVVGLNLLTVSQIYSLRREQAELISNHTSDQTAIAMLAYPTTQTITFNENGVSGSLLIDKERNLLAVFAWNLDVPSSDKTYQLWLIDPQGDRTSGGLLRPEPGYPFVTTVIRSQQPLNDFVGIGITLEPSGGSPKPTGPRVFHVDF